MHALALILSLGAKNNLFNLVNIQLNENCCIQHEAINKRECQAEYNSCHSIGCPPNDINCSEYLEIVSGLVHTQYKAILWCSASARAVDSQKSPQESKNMILK